MTRRHARPQARRMARERGHRLDAELVGREMGARRKGVGGRRGSRLAWYRQQPRMLPRRWHGLPGKEELPGSQGLSWGDAGQRHGLELLLLLLQEQLLLLRVVEGQAGHSRALRRIASLLRTPLGAPRGRGVAHAGFK